MRVADIALTGWLTALEALARALRVFKVFETLAHKGRLARNGLAPGAVAPVAPIRFRGNCHDPRCACHVAARWEGLRGFSRDADTRTLRARLSPFAAMIELADFEAFDDYLRRVSKISDGNDRREAARARRLGYATRRIGFNSHLQSLADIKGSKLVRSGGVMTAALYSQANAPAPEEDRAVAFEAPRCAEHWQIDFGVFNNAEPERMVAKATLGRSGNLVEVVFFMGHGAALRHGVAKLLFFDMMKWLMDSPESLVAGVEFLNYGAVEEGGQGRDTWRRRLGFRPFAVDAPPPRERDWRPEGWNPAAYWALNPDVRAAGKMPLAHYRLMGVFEGRAYLPGKPRAAAANTVSGAGLLDDFAAGALTPRP
jgi:hypothetical protein